MRKPTQKDLAKRYAVTSRTIRSWQASGAPLYDTEAMKRWLAGQRTMTDATLSTITPTTPPHASQPAKRPKTLADDVGAAHALGRLEREERAAYERLQKAISGGDPSVIRSARRAWLEIAGELRKADMTIEHSRRDHDTISRAEAERVLRATGNALRLAHRAVVAGLPDFEQADKFSALQLLHTAAPLLSAPCPALACPPWAQAALRAGLLGEFTDAGLAEWFEAIAQGMAMVKAETE